jgi:hypothetical protein
MHISFALFADAANLSQEGKLNVLGVFDAVQVATLPAVHPRATLVVRLKGVRSDVGSHVLALSWVNPRGDELWGSAGEVAVGTPPPGVHDMDLPVIITLDLPLDASGAYAMRVSLDGTLTAEVPLQVRAAAGAPAMAGSPAGMLS